MKKYIIIIFAVITFILTSCATRMRGFGYNNDYGYDTPRQGKYSYGYNRHRYGKKDRFYRDSRAYRYGDGDYDDYRYGDNGNYDRNYRYDGSRYNVSHGRHHHKRIKGLVIVL